MPSLALFTLFSVLATQVGATSVQVYPADFPVLFQAQFTSCPDGDEGEWGERAFEHFNGSQGRVDWRLEMGPRTQFAIFKGPLPDEHVEHDDARNLLGRGYDYDAFPMRKDAYRNWTVPSLLLRLEVHRVDGSYTNCESFFVTVSAERRPTYAHR